MPKALARVRQGRLQGAINGRLLDAELRVLRNSMDWTERGQSRVDSRA